MEIIGELLKILDNTIISLAVCFMGVSITGIVAISALIGSEKVKLEEIKDFYKEIFNK